MKKAEIIKILNQELATQDVEALNQHLKSKNNNTKFRLTGPGFTHFGFTGLIKAVTEDGIKIYNVNRVNLVRFEDIQTFAKAKPREERKVVETKKPTHQPPTKKMTKAPDDDDDYDNDDDFDELADEEDDVIENEHFAAKIKTETKNSKKKKIQPTGSRFIPTKK